MKTVGIIGAGACGLCAIRHSIAGGLSPIAWEHDSSIGGTWNYTESPENDEFGYPACSGVYQDLIANLPKEVFRFPDFPYTDEENSFLHHTRILRYLKLYAEEYELEPHIKFNHRVNLVEPIFEGDNQTSWKVTVENLKTGEIYAKICDFLMVCNGHYSVQRKPHIKDIENFTGIQLHSHSYRRKLDFAKKTIAILGAGISGVEIALDLADVVKKIYICHNNPAPHPSSLPDNVYQRKGIVEANKDGFLLNDGSFIEADVLLNCTGYEYDFHFLSPECHLRVENKVIKPLYNYVLHTEFPTMGFPGLHHETLTFPFFDVQVRYLVSIFSGKTTLPSRAQMNLETERAIMRFVLEGNDPKNFFRMLFNQGKYVDHLLDAIKQEHLPPYYVKLYMIVLFRVFFDATRCKQYEYTICSDDSIRTTLNGKNIHTTWSLYKTIISRICTLSVTNFREVIPVLSIIAWYKTKVFIVDTLSRFGLCDNYL